MSDALSLVFAGTPEFSVPVLDALMRSQHRVLAVYTQPDRPAGRGRHKTMSAVKQFALQRAIPIEQPLTLRDPAAIRRLCDWKADALIVVAYGLLLPQSVLDGPRLGCFNVHASLLPRWRGAAPIQRAILAGDELTGVTIMKMDAGLDTGAMLLKRTTPIFEQDTAATLHERLSVLGSQALIEVLNSLETIGGEPQPSEGATYAPKIGKSESLIDWSQSALQIDRQVRAFNPWPIAQTSYEGRQFRIWEASPTDAHHDAAPGTVLRCASEGIVVATGRGMLLLRRVQLAGRKAMSASEFLNAHRLQGAVLGS